MDSFGPEREWCDRRCERCTVSATCEVFIRDRGTRWAHEQRGRDPDAPDVVAEDFRYLTKRALEVAVEIARDEGVDLDAPAPKRARVLGSERLGEAAMALALAIGPIDGPARGMVLFLVGKVHRIATYLALEPIQPVSELPEDSVWTHTGAPNLFLVQRTRQELEAMLVAMGRTDLGPAFARLDHLLAGMLTALSPLRAELDERIASGRAPSPWVVLPP